MRRLITILLITIIPFAVFGAGAVGPDFLRVNPHAKTSAMSSAYCALVDDVNSIYFNPAGMSQAKKASLSFTHFTAFSDTNYEYIAGIFPMGITGAVGFSAMADYTSAFREFDEYGQDVGNVDNKDFLFTGAYAYPVADYFSTGINVKGFYSQLYKYSKMGAAVDLGMLFNLGTESPELFAGAAIQNLGFQTAYISVVDAMPINIKAGLGLKTVIYDKTTGCFAVDVNRLITKDELPTLDFGADICVQDVISFRAGYGLRHDVATISLGIGLVLDQMVFAYSYQPFDVLGSSHRLSLDVMLK